MILDNNSFYLFLFPFIVFSLISKYELLFIVKLLLIQIISVYILINIFIFFYL